MVSYPMSTVGVRVDRLQIRTRVRCARFLGTATDSMDCIRKVRLVDHTGYIIIDRVEMIFFKLVFQHRAPSLPESS